MSIPHENGSDAVYPEDGVVDYPSKSLDELLEEWKAARTEFTRAVDWLQKASDSLEKTIQNHD